LVVRGDRLCGLLTTLRGTEIIQTGSHFNVMTVDLSVVFYGHSNGTLVGDTQECNFTRDRVQRSNLDSLAGVNRHGTQFSGLELDSTITTSSGNE
jgi:hypothetical protein